MKIDAVFSMETQIFTAHQDKPGSNHLSSSRVNIILYHIDIKHLTGINYVALKINLNEKTDIYQ